MKGTIINILKDLRFALLICFLSLLTNFVICYINRSYIYDLITKPIVTIFNKKYNLLFVYTSIFDSFAADLLLSFYSAILLSLPIFLICIYWFFKKSLYSFEKKILIILLCFSTILMIISNLIVYYFLLPHFIKFFAFDVNNATPMFKINDYIGTFFYLIFSVNLFLQFPIILFILTKFGFLKKNILTKYRKLSIVIIFIISAIITPPDVLSQIFIALMMIILYEITNYIIQMKIKK